MATAKRLKLRCFLEGQEVPLVAINIQVAPNSPMVATLQLPPLSEGTKLKPRTLVHVYFLDFWPEAPPHAYKRGESIDANDRGPGSTFDYSLARYKDQIGDGTINYITSDIAAQRYKLLFVGETVGFQWVKTPLERSLVLQCHDLSSYWDYAIQFNNTDLFGPGYKAMFSGGGTTLFTDFLSSPGECITGIIMSKSVQYPRLEGLLGGLVHLLEAIGGAYYVQNGKAFAGQNIFFSVAELRLKITQMITAYEKDPSSKKLLGGQYDGLFGRTLGKLGDEVSFRKAINALSGVIFHESYGQPCPLYRPGRKGNIDGYERKDVAEDSELSFVVTDSQALIKSLDDIETSIENTVSPSEAEQLEGSTATNTPLEIAKAQKDELALSLRNVAKGCQTLDQKAKKHKFDKASRMLTEARTSVMNAERQVNARWKKGVTKDAVRGIELRLAEARNSLKLISELSVVTSSKKNAIPARLNQFIFRPDVWFTAPPRCNVIFPEQYFSLTYNRSFLQEPTRLLLKTNDEFYGEDELFDCLYFAPKLEGLKGQKAELQKMLMGDIMSHEIYTGILPIFEKMGEFNIFGVRAGSAPKAKSKDPKAPPAKPAGPKPKVGLAQRSCNFLFFRYRFGARQMQVQGLFNPYIACGFPGFIIDKYADLAKITKLRDMMVYAGFKFRPESSMLGTHFLGSFNQVSHSADQAGGGNTSIVVQFPREYNESIEFLGASNKQTQQAEIKLEMDAVRDIDVAAIDRPGVGNLGPQFGVITKVADVTSTYRSAAGEAQQTLPFYGGARRKGTGEITLKVPVGVTKTATEWGPEVVEAVGGDGTKDVSFRAYRLSERVPKYRQEKILMPAEELIRPGWYGNCWAPNMIGEVYEDFFRIGAITDAQQVADPSGSSTGLVTADATDALQRSADRGKAGDDPLALNSDSNAPAIWALQNEATIEQSCSFLLYVYSYIRMNGLDVEDFIRSYTWRPIATMVDMFGSSDLKYDDDGSKAIQGIEGFHSRAFGQFEDLFALVNPEVETVLGTKRGSSLARKADTRRRKWEAVRDFVDALSATRAVLG